MSRLTGNDARSLMEAYSAVYAPQELTEEQIWEEVENWVNSLLEEGYDLSDYTWEEMYEAYLNEVKDLNLTKGASPSSVAQMDQRRKNIEARGGTLGQIGRSFTRAFGSGEQIKKLDDEDTADRRREQTALKRSKDPNWKPSPKEKPKEEPTQELNRNRNLPATTPARPSGAAAPSAKPAPAGQTGDKAKDMETFAKANPKLAAAAAEKSRIRGTSQTDNPLMKDMRSRMPLTPSVQSSDVAKLGGGNQSLVSNPNAAKAAAPAPTSVAQKFASASARTATAPPSSPAPTPSATPAPAAAKPAAATPAPAPKPTPAATGSKKPGSIVSSFDPFDVVIGHLLDEGYADTEEAALAIMANMSGDWRESILEGVGGYDDPVLGPHTPVGQAARKAAKVVAGTVTGAIQGAKGAMKSPSTAKPVLYKK